MINLTELSKDIHKVAVEHGWWEEEVSFSEFIALCHCELSEAMEEYRNDRPMVYVDDFESLERKTDITQIKPEERPEGIAVELADCIIRILDWCGSVKIDIDNILKSRRAGDMYYTLSELVAECHWTLSKAWQEYGYGVDNVGLSLAECVHLIQFWCENNEIDLDHIIQLKHEYNKTRPWRHNGKRC